MSEQDQPANANPDTDTSGWRQIEHTDARPLFSRADDGIRWYRTRFDAPGAQQGCALFLGRIQEVDEVYLNGRLIGASGRMGPKWFDYVSAYRLTRSYDLPDGLLKPADNVLAIRVLTFYLDSRIPTQEIRLGPAYQMHAEARETNRWVERTETAVLSLHLIGAILIAVAALSAGGAVPYRWLALLMITMACAYAIESLTLYSLRLEYPWLKRITYFLMLAGPPLYLRYHYALFGGYARQADWIAALLPLPFALLHQFNLPVGLVDTSYNLWHMSFLPFGFMVLFKLLRNTIAGLPDAGITLSAVLAPVAGFALAVLDINVLPGEIDPIEAGGVLMTLLLLVGFARRYAREHGALMCLSKGVLEAQDAERRRIARELHDGLGQRMVATRLMLDALHMKNPEAGLEEPVNSLRDAVADLRAMVYALRPAVLEDHDLVTALRTYSQRTTELTGTLVELVAEDMTFDLPSDIEEHVFRIFQESINNAIRHGLASRVTVKFACNPSQLSLEVTDNGDGFRKQEREGSGVGLTAMAERARVCQGRLHIDSKPGQGTVVRLEIPLGINGNHL